MSDSPFLRPGSDPEPAPDAWPYEAQGIETEPLEIAAPIAPDEPPAAPPPQRPRRRLGAVLVAGVVGLVVGGIAGGWLSGLFFADPESIAITVDVFPEHIGNLERPDLAAAAEGDSVANNQFEADFKAQREGFRFAYGGDGASVDYGQFLLTIVNGAQSLPLPSDAAGTPGSASPILVSHDTDSVSCVFRPEVGLYNSAVLQTPADLSANGWTECVLNDVERHISLKLDSRIPGGAAETSLRFAGILERAHESLVA